MPGIARHSSRRASLAGFLPGLLDDATSYDRIAGYFSSSILEVAGEAIDRMAPGAVVRVVCNSQLDPLDVLTARAAQQAMTREWRSLIPADVGPAQRARLLRLHQFLQSGRLQVRVLPDERFGLIHGKAGVVTRADGSQLAFIGSANESRRAWEMNYEIVWSDDSADGVDWVRQEFAALWNDKAACPLADAIVVDIERLAGRVVLPGLREWRDEPAADASAAIELPIYRQENGLWSHQKWFIREAFERHKAGGARLVLADQVGLGKTIQLALAAKLMLLWGTGNVVALVPKPLMEQWQAELWHLLQLPTARWTGTAWIDERGVVHPATGPDGIKKCPRRFGLISTGLIRRNADVRDWLTGVEWECVILDEAHHARRTNLGATRRKESAQPNRLLHFMQSLAARSRSVLLATATPVQLDPIELYDLLHVLNRGNCTVLGSHYSRWLLANRVGLDIVAGDAPPPPDLRDRWEWMRDPFPPGTEHKDYQILRNALGAPLDRQTFAPEAIDRLSPPDLRRLERASDTFFAEANPYIRHVVRRTRAFLEDTLDPTTNEPYLPRVRVRLFGEQERESVYLPGMLAEAYEAAEAFCAEVGKRPKFNAGFLQTLLLRRVGSTIAAGKATGRKMLGPNGEFDDEDDDLDDDTPTSRLHPLTDAEEARLIEFLRRLEGAPDDPKYEEVERILLTGHNGSGPWLDLGCIVFSQYFDSVDWIANRLARRLSDEPIAIYAGAGKSGIYRGPLFERVERDVIKTGVKDGSIRLVIGTDAASEGLNLQRLGTLINLDLPWNPTRLEQRKGRIQRIGQARDEVYVYNLRYRGSVEDRVHQRLSGRLQAITNLFGQLPDTLEDAWVATALHDEARAQQVIDAIPETNPFELKYDRIEHVDWESCNRVLDSATQLDALLSGW
jgi:superfamily II DNA or RNA helicase